MEFKKKKKILVVEKRCTNSMQTFRFDCVMFMLCFQRLAVPLTLTMSVLFPPILRLLPLGLPRPRPRPRALPRALSLAKTTRRLLHTGRICCSVSK